MRKSAAVARSRRADPTISARSYFAERLRQIMETRGLTVTEVADRMRQHLPRGESFATSNLSHYRQGRSVPRNGHLKALSLALGVDPTELTSSDKGAPIQIDAPDRARGGAEGAVSSAAEQHKADGARSNGAVPRRARPVTSASVIGVEDLGAEVRLTIDQRVPWEIGLKVLQILKGSETD